MGDCALFPLFSTAAFLRVWQVGYCEADYTRCVRYQRSMSGEIVPVSLLPNGKSLPVLSTLTKQR
jgi:hypothetical protein